MEELIDREFGVGGTAISHSAAGRFFATMLVISLLLHLAAGGFLLTRKGGPGIPQINYIDLGMLPQQAAPAVQKEEAVTPSEQTMPTESATVEKPEPVAQQAPPAAASSEQMQHNSIAMGMSFGFFRSISEGETLRFEIREYYLTMLQKINESWWLIGGANPRDVRQDVSIIIRIARNGEVLERKLLRGSGSAGYDRAIMKALEVAAPFAPLPETYPGFYFEAPLRLVVPSGLMLAGMPKQSHLQ
ncbi:MAG: TonB C-terminal domain-containing protein [Geobacter sp.]|nr:TonB C-terminal domain-containing protein [Geobacter sp.]